MDKQSTRSPGRILAVLVIGVVVLSTLLFIFNAFKQSTIGLTGTTLSAPMIAVSSVKDSYMGYDSSEGGVAYGGTMNIAASKSVAREVSSVYYPYPSPEPTAGSPTLPADRKVIRNGSLSLAVKDVDQAVTQLQSTVVAYNGFVESVSVEGRTPEKKYGHVTIRVPSDKFDALIAGVKALALRVESEQISSNDVSAQIVDLEARLIAQKAEEEQYLATMKRSGEIKDILAVTERLSNVRERIEQTQGQMNYLSRQVSMSTLHISLTPEADPRTEVAGWKPLSILKESAKSMLAYVIALSYLAIALIVWTPALLVSIALIVVVIWVLTKIGVRIARKVFGDFKDPFKTKNN